MTDVSENNNIVDNGEYVSDNDSSSSDQVENDETIETVVYTNDPIDYTSHFENLETIGIFIAGLLVAYGIAFAFFKGFKK